MKKILIPNFFFVISLQINNHEKSNKINEKNSKNLNFQKFNNEYTWDYTDYYDPSEIFIKTKKHHKKILQKLLKKLFNIENTIILNNKNKLIKKNNSHINNKNNSNKNKINKMQDIRIIVERPNHNNGSPNNHQRPHILFTKSNLTCDENVNITNRSPSSEEDNSPTEMNNCRRLTDKPPLVKRLTMGLLRSAEDSRPLVHTTSSVTSGSSQTISDGYVNEGICDPDKIISSKFGDSCRKSLMSMTLDNSRCTDNEFDFKKHFLRETSSGKFFKINFN